MQISILGYRVELEIIILIVVLYLVIVVQTACNCTDIPGMMESFRNREGFSGANTNYGQSAPFSIEGYNKVDTKKWGQPSLVYGNGMPESQAVKNFYNRKEQPIPLPEGELDMFATTPFKPECCPNTFSNSSGCACMTQKQYNYLNNRGGNNVPYSEY
jgi:hypothetical protein